MHSLGVGPLLRTVRRRPGIWALMVMEVAVGVTTIGSLLISGAWYGDSGQQPSGLDEANLILISTYTPSPAGLDPAAAERAIREQERADLRLVRGLPDVEAATRVTSTILEDRWAYPSLFSVRGDARVGATPPSVPARAAPEAVGWITYADGDLARALSLRFAAGAMPALPDVTYGPGAADLDDRPVAAVLTRCLADRLFRDPRAAVGARLVSTGIGDLPVAGVVEDVAMRMALVPQFRCTAFVFGGAPVDHEARLLARTRPGRRGAVLAAATAALAPASGTRLADVRAFDSTTGAHHRIGRGLLKMLGMFGVLVAVIALLGALAATSFLVAQRTRQIGIRRALGATRGDIVTYFLVESAIAAAMGSVIGVAATVALFALMRKVFHAIHFSPALMLLALVTLWLGSIVATLIPALRAARVPPSVAGRSL